MKPCDARRTAFWANHEPFIKAALFLKNCQIDKEPAQYHKEDAEWDSNISKIKIEMVLTIKKIRSS